MRERTPLPIYATIAFLCLLLIVPLQSYINKERKAEGLEQSPKDLLEVAGTLATGGFRGVFVDVLWIRAENLRMKKEWYELLSLYELISKLQPNFVQVWIFNSWNMAWNIANDWPGINDKWRWVKKGIDFAWQGVEKNPRSADMWFWVAWIHSTRFDWIIFRDEATKLQKKFYEWKGKHNLEVALKAMRKALDLMPDSDHQKPAWERVYCHLQMKYARELEQEGKEKEALVMARKAFNRWRQLRDMYPKAWTHRGICIRYMKEAAELVDQLQQNIEKEKYNPTPPE